MLPMKTLLTLLTILITQSIQISIFPETPPLLSHLYIKEATKLPSGWSLDTNKPASPQELIVLRIGLAQNDPKGLEQTLLEISDPASSSYGKYLSQDAILRFMQPTNNTVNAVKSWLSSHGISTNTSLPSFSVTPTHDWYKLNITVADANRLLETIFYAYRNSDTNERIVRALNYSLPRFLKNAIDTIQPTTIFSSAPTRRNAARSRFAKLGLLAGSATIYPSQFPNCTNSNASIVPPWCVRKLYNVGNYTALPPAKLKGNMIGMYVQLPNFVQTRKLLIVLYFTQSWLSGKLCSIF